MTDTETYQVGAWITGVIAFLAAWLYAVTAYGWFLGLGLGWIPAAFIGVVAGFLWPLIALAVAGLAILLLKGG